MFLVFLVNSETQLCAALLYLWHSLIHRWLVQNKGDHVVRSACVPTLASGWGPLSPLHLLFFFFLSRNVLTCQDLENLILLCLSFRSPPSENNKYTSVGHQCIVPFILKHIVQMTMKVGVKKGRQCWHSLAQWHLNILICSICLAGTFVAPGWTRDLTMYTYFPRETCCVTHCSSDCHAYLHHGRKAFLFNLLKFTSLCQDYFLWKFLIVFF